MDGRDGLMDQLCVDTATWGLRYWEQTLGIPVEPGKEPEYRRSRIRSKLRGSGVTTVALIKSVAESFSNGEVAVTEYPASLPAGDQICGDCRHPAQPGGSDGVPAGDPAGPSGMGLCDGVQHLGHDRAAHMGRAAGTVLGASERRGVDMSVTPNYELTLPAGSDWADVAVLNRNMEKIDAALWGLDEGKVDRENVGKPAAWPAWIPSASCPMLRRPI